MFRIYKINIYLIILLFAAIVLSGCSLPFAKKLIPDNWRNEIVMGRDCGVDGLQCCVNQNPSCQFGLECCNDPNNSKVTMCSDNCSCGKKNNFCCKDGQKCESGLVCSNAICQTCGGKDQPCCEGEKQCGDSKLACYQLKCIACGVAGNPCCPGETACAEEKNNDDKRTECRNGLCEPCGSADNILCNKEPYCQNGLMPNNGLCLMCGELNLPCCSSDSGIENDCDQKLGLKCVKGFCSK
jgi:hypothetical protein